MKKYELTVVIDGKTTPAKQKNIQEFVEKVITTFEGKLGKVEEWGKKDLMTQFGKSTSGVYFMFPIEILPASAKGIETKLKSENAIIRYLLVKA